EYLNPNLTFGEDHAAVIAQYVAESCEQAGVSGIAFNQGSWYFGSQVAGSAARLNELLDEMTLGTMPRRASRLPRRRRRLVVIACGKKKVWDEAPERGPCAAKDAYTGRFFAINRRYAERFGSDGWMILSSRFGFLYPETLITNYNTTFLDPSTGPID